MGTVLEKSHRSNVLSQVYEEGKGRPRAYGRETLEVRPDEMEFLVIGTKEISAETDDPTTFN